MNTPLTVAVDRQALDLGDVIILKRQRQGGFIGRLFTVCTKCEKPFPTKLRRMKRGEAVLRNVPQCKTCRHEPKVKSDDIVRVGDLVEALETMSGNGITKGRVYLVRGVGDRFYFFDKLDDGKRGGVFTYRFKKVQP